MVWKGEGFVLPGMGLQDVIKEELSPVLTKANGIAGCLSWDPLSSWAQAQLVWKLERTLFSSSCQGSPFPPRDVLELHSFLITKGKQAHPWCSEQREERNQLPACKCLKHKRGRCSWCSHSWACRGHSVMASLCFRVTEQFGLEGTWKIISFQPPAMSRTPSLHH